MPIYLHGEAGLVVVRVGSESSLEEGVGLVLHVLVVVADGLGVQGIWVVVISPQNITEGGRGCVVILCTCANNPFSVGTHETNSRETSFSLCRCVASPSSLSPHPILPLSQLSFAPICSYNSPPPPPPPSLNHHFLPFAPISPPPSTSSLFYRNCHLLPPPPPISAHLHTA